MPNIGIKTNLEKFENKIREKRERLDKLENDYNRRKTRLDINLRYLEEEEKKYENRKKLLEEKHLSFNGNKSDDTLNDKSIEELTAGIKSSSLSDPIEDNKLDQSISKLKITHCEINDPKLIVATIIFLNQI